MNRTLDTQVILPWERPGGSLDAVALQRTLRERLSERLKGLSWEQQSELLQQEASNLIPQFRERSPRSRPSPLAGSISREETQTGQPQGRRLRKRRSKATRS